MWIVPAALVAGLLVGVAAASGDLRALRRSWINLWQLLVLAVAAGAIAASTAASGITTALIGVSLVGFAIVAGANLRLAGAGIILTGVLLNLAVFAINTHVPVRSSAVIAAGIASADELDRVRLGAGREFADEATQLDVLGGVLPVRQVGEVFSFGDLIVMAGLATFGFRLVRPDPKRHGARLEQLRDRHPSATAELVIDLDELATIPPRHTPGLTPRPGTRTLEGSAMFGAETESALR